LHSHEKEKGSPRPGSKKRSNSKEKILFRGLKLKPNGKKKPQKGRSGSFDAKYEERATSKKMGGKEGRAITITKPEKK